MFILAGKKSVSGRAAKLRDSRQYSDAVSQFGRSSMLNPLSPKVSIISIKQINYDLIMKLD
jgi:hypothetical protein